MTDRQAYSRVRIGNEWDGFGAIIISAPSGEIWKIFKNMEKYWKYGKILFIFRKMWKYIENCGEIGNDWDGFGAMKTSGEILPDCSISSMFVLQL